MPRETLDVAASTRTNKCHEVARVQTGNPVSPESPSSRVANCHWIEDDSQLKHNIHSYGPWTFVEGHVAQVVSFAIE